MRDLITVILLLMIILAFAMIAQTTFNTPDLPGAKAPVTEPVTKAPEPEEPVTVVPIAPPVASGGGATGEAPSANQPQPVYPPDPIEEAEKPCEPTKRCKGEPWTLEPNSPFVPHKDW